MREFFKYLYYLMYVLVIITGALLIVSNDPVAVLYWLICASIWVLVWVGLMLTRPVEYLYLISYFTSENRLGRYMCHLNQKLDNIDKIKEIESRLKNHNNVELVGIQNIQLISTTKLS
jgi:hypothetical protein